MRFRFHFFFLLSVPFSLCAFDFPSAPRQTSLGMTGTIQADPWSSFQNPAAIAFCEASSIGICAENHFGIKDLNTFSFTSALVVNKNNVVGISGSRTGTENFSEQQFNFSVAKKFSPKFSFGIQVLTMGNSLKDDGYGNRYTWTVRMGMVMIPLEKLKIGFSVFNPSHTRIIHSGDERIPVVMRSGIAYSFSKKLTWYTDTEKRNTESLRVGSGIEYKACGIMSFRTGFITTPFEPVYGFGLQLKTLRLDVSAIYHPVMGFNPSLSLTSSF
jgi:hypothetical protein